MINMGTAKTKFGVMEFISIKEGNILRKSLTMVLALLLAVLMTAPAAAAPEFTLKVNGQVYEGEFEVIEGTTMVPLDWIGGVIGAQTSVEKEEIKMEKEQDILILAVGSKEAEFNQQQGIMFQAPAINNDKYMVPLRYVAEGFGEKVEWDPATYEIAVKTGTPTAAGKLLLQISEAMVQNNSYKMKADTLMDMDIVADGENRQMSMSGTVNASMSQEPLILVMDSNMIIRALLGTDEENPEEMVKTSTVINEDGYFLTMSGYEGWIKMDMEGIDFNQIMEQSGSQDPLQSVMQMAEFGAVISEKADKTIEGKDYGVINIVMGQDAVGKYIENLLGQTGLLNLGVDPQENPEFESFMQEMFANMKIDMTYDIVYDKETLLPHNMLLGSTLSMEMDIPANETAGTPAQSMQMKTEQKASYHMYDYGIAFPVPIIEDYKTMNEWLAEQIPVLPDTEG